MVRSEKCLMRWYLNVMRLSECRLSRWTHYISRLRHHRLIKGSLKLNTLWLEWMNVKLGLSLLKATPRVYFTLHLSYLGLFPNFEMHLPLSLSLCKCYLYFPYPRTIKSLLKFHWPHRSIIIRVISTRGLKVYLSAQVNANILQHSGEKATIGEYEGRAVVTWDHVHHHQVHQVDPSSSKKRVNEECLIIRDLVLVFAPW